MEPLLSAYFEDGRARLTAHQIEGYDLMLDRQIGAVLRGGSPVVLQKPDVVLRVWLGGRDGSGVGYARPTVRLEGGAEEPLLPGVARSTGATYECQVLVDVLVETEDRVRGVSHSETFRRVPFARLPVMLHSRLCFLRGLDGEALRELGEDAADPGGYFVVGGREKVVVSQERVAPNVPILRRRAAGGGVSLFLRSAPLADSVKPVEFELLTRGGEGSVRAQARRFEVTCRIRGVSSEVPLSVVFRGLGVESDAEMVELCLGAGGGGGGGGGDASLAAALRQSLVRSEGVFTRGVAAEYVGARTRFRTRDQGLQALGMYVLPGVGDGLAMKGRELGRLVGLLLRAALGQEPLSDLESFVTKRVDLAGPLLAGLVSDGFNQYANFLRVRLEAAYGSGAWTETGDPAALLSSANVRGVCEAPEVTAILSKSFRGNWAGLGDPKHAGIVQDLSRLSYIGFLSHLRRVNNPLDRGLKLLPPRYLHGTQYGVVCPVESPDGINVGLTKNLALTASVTSAGDPRALMRFAAGAGAQAAMHPEAGACRVFVNGVWSFGVADGPGLVRAARAARLAGELDRFVSVAYSTPRNEVYLSCDAGRCVRPLVRASRAGPGAFDPAGGWAGAVSGPDPVVEMLDVLECDTALVAMRAGDVGPSHTHVELHPVCMFGVYAATLPFANHNPNPRCVLSAAQGKQAAGVFSSAARYRLDSSAFALDYPERPLVGTSLSGLLGSNERPGGANAVVALMCFSGFNMEDAVVLNAGSVRRGLLTTTHWKTLTFAEERGASPLSIARPEGRSGTLAGGLDEQGLPAEGAALGPGSLLVGMVESRESAAGEEDTFLVSRSDRREELRDRSVAADASHFGSRVDKVLVTGGAGSRTARVRLRSTRFPREGDKFASRHAQKGVCGMLVAEEDMPFTRDGVRPDVVINPHGLPTRMTVGHVLESVLAKASAVSGVSEGASGTPFDVDTDAMLERVAETLRGAGLDGQGEETVYSGATGLPLPESAFVCPVFYQRLKHMSKDKVKARAQGGAVSAVTRQPAGSTGATRPLKLGEMETSAILGHGTALFLHEGTMLKSDAIEAWYDSGGRRCSANHAAGLFRGPDPHDADLHRVSVPHGFATLQHELCGIGIGTAISTEPQ